MSLWEREHRLWHQTGLRCACCNVVAARALGTCTLMCSGQAWHQPNSGWSVQGSACLSVVACVDHPMSALLAAAALTTAALQRDECLPCRCWSTRIPASLLCQARETGGMVGAGLSLHLWSRSGTMLFLCWWQPQHLQRAGPSSQSFPARLQQSDCLRSALGLTWVRSAGLGPSRSAMLLACRPSHTPRCPCPPSTA